MFKRERITATQKPMQTKLQLEKSFFVVGGGQVREGCSKLLQIQIEIKKNNVHSLENGVYLMIMNN